MIPLAPVLLVLVLILVAPRTTTVGGDRDRRDLTPLLHAIARASKLLVSGFLFFALMSIVADELLMPVRTDEIVIPAGTPTGTDGIEVIVEVVSRALRFLVFFFSSSIESETVRLMVESGVVAPSSSSSSSSMISMMVLVAMAMELL